MDDRDRLGLKSQATKPTPEESGLKLISKIEAYAREMMNQGGIAHDFEHVNRVRGWALRIAEAEGYEHSDRVQAAGLLHDIGLVHGRAGHGPRGAEMAAEFLAENRLFAPETIAEIARAIRCHTSLEEGGPLADILRDADILDLLGPLGILRGSTSHAQKPEYPPGNPKGETWGITAAEITERFQNGQGTGSYLVDEFNFQISCFENIRTPTAQQWARPWLNFVKTFIGELERQVQMAITDESN